MRIAANAVGLLRHPSGLGTHTRQLLRAMAFRHDDLLVYAARDERFDGGPEPAPVALPGGKLSRCVAQSFLLPPRLRRDKADVFLALSPLHALPVCPCPQVTVVHDLTPLVVPSAGPKLRWVFRVLLPAVLRASRQVITISEATKRDLVRRFRVPPDRVHVTYLAYDARRFHRDAPPPANIPALEGERYLLYVGDQSPHKNIAGLLRAFAASAARRKGLQLALAGRKDPRFFPGLQALAQELGVEAQVAWLGYVADDDLPGLIAGATAFVFPSRYEGFGLPVLEAMACGTPVITSNTSSLPEVAGDAALLVPPTDTDALAEAIDRIASDDALRRDLSERGVRRAWEFSWSRCAEQTLDICRRAANAPPRPLS